MDDLTKEQKTVLCTLYKEYLKTKDKYFFNSNYLIEHYFTNYNSDDMSDICWELCSAGYITCERGSDLANEINLSNKTVIFMENRFKNGVKEVVNFITSLI